MARYIRITKAERSFLSISVSRRPAITAAYKGKAGSLGEIKVYTQTIEPKVVSEQCGILHVITEKQTSLTKLLVHAFNHEYGLNLNAANTICNILTDCHNR